MSKLKVDALSSIDFTGDSDSILLENDGDVTFSHDVNISGSLDLEGSINASGLSADGTLSIDAGVGGVANSSIRFKVDGSEKLRIDSDGHLMIRNEGQHLSFATSGNPNNVLRSTDTYGTNGFEINVPNGLTIATDSNGNGNGVFQVYNLTDAETQFIVTDDGDVGIGTNAPAVELDIASAAPQIRLTDTDGGYSEVANVGGHLLLQADKGNTQASSYIRFDVDATEFMRITNAGRLGIGTIAPSRLLHVYGSSQVNASVQTSNTRSYMSFVDSTTVNGGPLIGSHGDDFLVANGALNTEKFRVATSGNVGIGTASPTSQLHLANGTASPTLRLENTATSGGNYYVQSYITGSTSRLRFGETGVGEHMCIETGGNVGIGTDNPARQLEIAGNNNGSSKSNYLRITDTDTSATGGNQQGGIEFYTNDGGNENVTASIENLYAGSGAGSELTFNTAPSGASGVSERMRINETGKVGINHTDPDRMLQVKSSEQIISTFGSTSTVRGLVSFTDANTSGDAYVMVGAVGDKLNLYAGGTTSRMVIDASGNVGYNLSTPTNVKGGRVVEGLSTTGFEYIAGNSTTGTVGGEFTGAYIFRSDDTSGTQPHYAGMWAKQRDSFGRMHLYFAAGRDNYENDTPDMQIEGEFGNVMIGGANQSGNAKLQVTANTVGNALPTLGSLDTHTPLFVSGADADYGLLVGTSSATGHVYMQSQRTDGTATAYDILLNPVGGNVGIGCEFGAPASQLHLQQTLSDNESATYITLENRNGSGASANTVGVDFYAGAAIASSPNRRARILAHGSVSGGHIDLAFHAAKNSAGFEAMRITQDGNVGIATDSPVSRLTIDDTATANADATNPDHATISLRYSSTKRLNIGDYAATPFGSYIQSTNTSGSGFVLALNPEGGNVGIGTASPNKPLEISQTNGGAVIRLSNPDSTVSSGESLGSIEWQSNDASTPGGTGTQAIINVVDTNTFGNAYAMTFTTSNAGSSAEHMRISEDGNVGIGQDNPSSNLHITKASNGTGPTLTLELDDSGLSVNAENLLGGIDFVGNDAQGLGTRAAIRAMGEASSGETGLRFFTSGSGGSGDFATERMRLTNEGHLLIGRTSTANAATQHGIQLYESGVIYQFSSSTGNSDIHRWHNGSGTKIAYLQGDGDLIITGTYSPSDERLKENIVDAPSGNIDDLQVRSFDWKSDGKHQKYGFVAQELNSVAPYAVSEGETEEDMLAVNYASLVPMLVKEIQDLKLELQKIKDTI